MVKQKILKATHPGTIKIAEIKIPCAVLDDGTRILRERSVARALGKKGSGAYWQKKKQEEKGAVLPEYISTKNLAPYIGEDVKEKLINPITYKTKSGTIARGLPATLLPEICNIWLKARDEGALYRNQTNTAKKAEILIRGLAHIGIIALIDEATGYQDDRVKDALAKILEDFIAKEMRPYIGTFPTEFYRQIFLLNRWPWHPTSTKRPGVIAKWTNDLVYERLAPGVLDELRKRNPIYKAGQRRRKLFQFLSEEVGEPKLKSHFDGLIALAKAAPNWRRFKEMVNRVYPKKWDQLLLDMEDPTDD